MIPANLRLPDGEGGWVDVSVVRPDGTAWAPVIGGKGATRPPFVPDAGPTRNIASNCAVLQNEFDPGAAPSAGAAVGTRHLLHANAEKVTLGYFFRPNPGFGAKEPTVIRVWVRRPNSAWTPVMFGGKTEVSAPGAADQATLDANRATLKTDHYSDPFPGPFYAGDMIEVLTWTNRAPGAGGGSTMGSQGQVRSTYDLGRVDGDPAKVVSATGRDYYTQGRSIRPSVILSTSSQKSSWAIIGDSNSVNPGQSYAMTAFRDRSIPHVMNGKHGLGHWELLNGWWDFQLGEQVKWADSVWSAMLTNDFRQGTADAIKKQLVDVWTLATGTKGVKRWVQALKTPSAARQTDGTLKGSPDVTVAVNRWLLDGAPVLNGAPAPTGTTDPAAVRARVARRDGTIKPGAGAHPVGDGWIADSVWMLEESPDNAVWKKDYDANDVNHYYQAGHDAQAKEVAKLLALMGF